MVCAEPFSADTGTLSAEARRTIRSAVVLPSTICVLLLTLAFAAGLRAPEWVRYLPFAASLVLFGLPHGAVDHLVPDRLSGRQAHARSVLAVVVLYMVLSGLCLGLWFAAPVPAFVLFVCVTVFHWGAGDLHALLAFGPEGLDGMGRPARILLLLLRGAVPMLVPLLFFPGVYRGVATDVVGLFGADVSVLDGAFSPAFRVAVAAAMVVVGLLFCLRAAGDLAGRRPVLLLVGLETLLLTLFFAVVPPILAVGLYFTLWHSTRHIARLVLLDRSGTRRLRDRRPGRALMGFARDAAPLTGLALALLVGLYLVVPQGAEDPGSLLGLYLVLVSVLTLPHAALVTYMDLRQGVWEK